MAVRDAFRQAYRLLTGNAAAGARQRPPEADRHRSRNPFGWSDQFIASKDFLQRQEWIDLRYAAIRKHGGCCMACGRSKQRHNVTINVDHVIPRKVRPDLCLDINNLQILCADCNRGKGNKFMDDWR